MSRYIKKKNYILKTSRYFTEIEILKQVDKNDLTNRIKLYYYVYEVDDKENTLNN